MNSILEEKVYEAEGFIKEGEEYLVCKLKKSIYGVKQSLRYWNTAIDSYLHELGFKPSTSDTCIYVCRINKFSTSVSMWMI